MWISKLGSKREYVVTTEIKVNFGLFKSLELRPGDPVFLASGALAPEVVLSVYPQDAVHILGIVSDKELFTKVGLCKAKAKVLFIVNDIVKVEFTYT